MLLRILPGETSLKYSLLKRKPNFGSQFSCLLWGSTNTCVISIHLEVELSKEAVIWMEKMDGSTALTLWIRLHWHYLSLGLLTLHMAVYLGGSTAKDQQPQSLFVSLTWINLSCFCPGKSSWRYNPFRFNHEGEIRWIWQPFWIQQYNLW